MINLLPPKIVESSQKEGNKMVKPASFDSNGMKKGAWSEEEDNKLRAYVMRYGHWNWRLLPKYAGLARCGKSCRLRWVNYLKPGVKRGNFTKQEEELIAKLHEELGNRWSLIAAKFPGRTDNEIKNYWHTHIKKRPHRRTNPASKQLKSCKKPQIEPSASLLLNYPNVPEDSVINSFDHIKSSDSIAEVSQVLDLSWTDITSSLIPINPAPSFQNDYAPEKEILYPEFQYSTEFSISDSSSFNPTAINWFSVDDNNNISSESVAQPVREGSFWSELFTSANDSSISQSNILSQGVEEPYDPFNFPYFDHGIELF